MSSNVYFWVGFCVCSAQRSAARVRSLTEELEETRQAFKEAQERASSTQTSCTKLVYHKLNSLPGKLNYLNVKYFLCL